MRKICFKCGIEKEISEYYKHKMMADGHLNKCKDCTRKDVDLRDKTLRKDPIFVEKERTRHRRKYHRLGYREVHKPDYETKKRDMASYMAKYPEKKLAANASQRIVSMLGHCHHWSYNKEHWQDVIDISIKNHKKAHRFISYDQERMMYRRIDTMELLDTKEKHLEWINWCIENKED